MTVPADKKREIIKEIKAILRVRKKGARQLSLGLETEESRETEALNSLLKKQLEAKHPVYLDYVIGLIAGRSSEDTKWDTVRCFAKLFRDGQIHLTSESGDITGKQAVQYFTKEENWSKVQIFSENSAGRPVSERTIKMAETLFGETGSKTGMELARLIRENLRGWNKVLNRCDEKAGAGNYPGKKAIFNSRAVIIKLLAIEEPSEFIKSFEADWEKLSRISADLGNLDRFYSQFLDAWKALCGTWEDLRPNRHFLEKSSDIKEKMDRMEQILSAAEPYGMAHEIEGLIAEVSEANKAVLKKYREEMHARLESYIIDLTAILEKYNSPADLRNELLLPLNQFKKKIILQFNIPDIEAIHEAARDHYEESMDTIERHKSQGSDSRESKQ